MVGSRTAIGVTTFTRKTCCFVLILPRSALVADVRAFPLRVVASRTGVARVLTCFTLCIPSRAVGACYLTNQVLILSRTAVIAVRSVPGERFVGPVFAGNTAAVTRVSGRYIFSMTRCARSEGSANTVVVWATRQRFVMRVPVTLCPCQTQAIVVYPCSCDLPLTFLARCVGCALTILVVGWWLALILGAVTLSVLLAFTGRRVCGRHVLILGISAHVVCGTDAVFRGGGCESFILFNGAHGIQVTESAATCILPLARGTRGTCCRMMLVSILPGGTCLARARGIFAVLKCPGGACFTRARTCPATSGMGISGITFVGARFTLALARLVLVVINSAFLAGCLAGLILKIATSTSFAGVLVVTSLELSKLALGTVASAWATTARQLPPRRAKRVTLRAALLPRQSLVPTDFALETFRLAFCAVELARCAFHAFPWAVLGVAVFELTTGAQFA
jgi:hypothetical protein